MAKLRLYDEAVPPRAAVIGISCHVPDYRLCWSLNKSLGLALQRRKQDIVEHARGKELHYPVFEQRSEEGDPDIALIGNACGRRRLIPGQKEADFFLVLSGRDDQEADRLLQRLRPAEFVLAAFTVDFGALRMGHKLLL